MAATQDEAKAWVDLGMADGLLQAADLAEAHGMRDLAKTIRALVPSDVSVRTCSPGDGEPSKAS